MSDELKMKLIKEAHECLDAVEEAIDFIVDSEELKSEFTGP